MTTSMMLLGKLIVLQVLDLVLTVKVLNQGGREMNPVIAWLILRVGPVLGIAAAKLPLLAIGIWLVARPMAWTPHLLGLLCAVFAWVCWHNWRALR